MVARWLGAGRRGQPVLRAGIIDRFPVYVEGLRVVLGAHDVIVTEAAVAEGLSWGVDLFLVDPGSVGDDDLPAFITDASRVAPVLLLVNGYTGYTGRTAAPYLGMGARGMIDRRASTDTILNAIRAVLAGDQFWDLEASYAAPEFERPNDLDTLSPRERQVLRQIAQGLTHMQVATRLGISRHTVDTYVKRIRAKLDLGNKAELTRAAVLGATVSEALAR